MLNQTIVIKGKSFKAVKTDSGYLVTVGRKKIELVPSYNPNEYMTAGFHVHNRRGELVAYLRPNIEGVSFFSDKLGILQPL